MKILVVDDHPGNRKLLRAQLESEKHIVLEASDGLEALAVLEHEGIDLLISDILMPRMDGYRLCHEIRKLERFRRLPIVIYTATYTSPGDEKLALEVGANKYLRKPVSAATILAAIQEIATVCYTPNATKRMELEVLKEYNQRLVHKLEQKKIALEQANAELGAIRDQLAQVLEYIPAVLYSSKLDDNQVSPQMVNQNITRLLGFAPEECLSDDWWVNQLHPADRERQLAHLSGTLRQGSLTCEYRLRHKSGHYLWIEDRRRTIPEGAEGEAGSTYGIWIDITQRKQAELALAQLHHQHELILNSIAEGIHGIDLHGNITFENPAAARMLGWSDNDLAGKSAHALVHHTRADGTVYPETECPIFMTLRDGLSRRVDHEVFWRKDGSSFPVEYVVAPKRDENGDMVGAVVAFRDITERKQAEDAVRESEHKYRHLFESLSDAAFLVDAERGRIVDTNHRAETLLGLPRGEIIGLTLSRLQSPDAATDLFQQVGGYLSESGPRQYETEIISKDGRVTPVLASSAPIQLHGRKLLLSLLRDNTEQKKTQQQMLRAQRLESIGTLAGGIAHDLNNALAPVLMATSLLRMESPQAAEIIDNMEASARHGAEMVRQLLTFARGVEGQRLLLDPRHLIKEMEKIIRSSFPKNIQLEVKCASEVRSVLGDPTQLHQVLLNLCVNARDAMPNGGTLSIESENVQIDATYASSVPEAKIGSYVVCRISDTGTGIAPETLDRIFEPFFTTKGPDKGTGLGLSTALGIIKSHGGFVRVYSQLGAGSTFAVYLPVSASENVQPEPADPAPRRFRGSGQTILVVDDEAPVRQAVRAVLTALNFQVITAGDGTAALVQVAEKRNELKAVVTDMHMPNMDGLSFLRVLKHMLPQAGIIVASGRLSEREAAEVGKLGVAAQLHKPFTQEQLVQVLETLLPA